MASQTFRPETPEDVRDVVADAARSGARLEVRGGGSKAAFGAPREAAILDMSGLRGVIDYDPAELVLTARPGTPLAEIEALVASEGQMLAFEPFDHGPLYGQTAGAATIGGVVAAGISGSRRISAGAARDHLLGFHAVSGRGEAFVAGAKVVKNVTGYDLPKLAAGSWGRLFAITELTLKVLPRGRERLTLGLEGLSAQVAQAMLSNAMRAPADVQAAAHAEVGGGWLTVVRLEGFGPSVAARARMLAEVWRDHGGGRPLPETEADTVWGAIARLAPLADGRPLWRINVRPSKGPDIVAALAPLGARWLFDWAGGLVWLTFGGDPDLVRQAAEAASGHAMLVRADEAVRAQVPPLHPAPRAVAALEARVRAAFDPHGVFETGRFLDRAHAD